MVMSRRQFLRGAAGAVATAAAAPVAEAAAPFAPREPKELPPKGMSINNCNNFHVDGRMWQSIHRGSRLFAC